MLDSRWANSNENHAVAAISLDQHNMHFSCNYEKRKTNNKPRIVNTRSDIMYYKKEYECKYCKETFFTTKILRSRAKLTKMDRDFCMHYEEDNPMFYDINVCPNCGYAFHQSFGNINPIYIKELEESYIEQIKRRDLTGKRTVDISLEATKLGFITARITREKNVVIGDLVLKIAWNYRIKGDEEQEKRFLGIALEYFDKAFSEDNLERQGVDEDKLIYLIAELNVRLGNHNVARRWFSHLITDKSVSHKYKNYAVSRWQDYRYEERGV